MLHANDIQIEGKHEWETYRFNTKSATEMTPTTNPAVVAIKIPLQGLEVSSSNASLLMAAALALSPSLSCACSSFDFVVGNSLLEFELAFSDSWNSLETEDVVGAVVG